MQTNTSPRDGYFIAERNGDGSPGPAISSQDGATMVFDDFDSAGEVRKTFTEKLHIFKVAMIVIGEVLL